MDPVASVDQSNQMVAQLLQIALEGELELEKKLLRFDLLSELQATDPARGQAVDVVA